jgi:hypothetical protein
LDEESPFVRTVEKTSGAEQSRGRAEKVVEVDSGSDFEGC